MHVDKKVIIRVFKQIVLYKLQNIFFQKFSHFFHGQRRTLQLVYNKNKEGHFKIAN